MKTTEDTYKKSQNKMTKVRVPKSLLESDKFDSEIDYKSLKMAADVLRAINHPLRQRIVDLIDENGPLNVTEVYIKLRVEQSVASQHLGLLRDAGFLSTFKKGKYVYYKVNYERFREITESVVATLLN